jgi:hypothetical protein
MKCLSFSEEFFSGTGDPYEVVPSDRPTSCLQGIVSLPHETQIEIARHVLRSPCPDIYVDTEAFAFDVLEQLRKTDLCDGYDVPVRVYIDEECYYWLDIYEGDDP